jgi:hypothetical protein
MQGLMKTAFFGYLVFLTALLLVRDPMELVGSHDRGPWLLQVLMPWAHLMSFAVLAVLGLMVRWPLPRWLVAVLLILYGGMMEIAQSYLPPRTADWEDWLQDVAGVIVGSVLCWMAAVTASGLRGWQEEAEKCMPVAASGDWKTAQDPISRGSALIRSWWT